MPTLLMVVALAAAPTAGLTLSIQLGAPPSATYLDAVEQALVGEGLAVRRLDTACDGVRGCLLARAREEGVGVLVAVAVAQRRSQSTLDIEAIRAEDGATVAQLTFVVTEHLGEGDRVQLADFAARARQATPTDDAPLLDAVKVTPGPGPTARPIVIDVPPPPAARRSRAPAWAMLGGAGASGAAAGVFVGLATSARRQVESTTDPSPLTRAQATQLAQTANRDYAIALGTGLVAGALLTGAVVWLLAD